MATLSNRAAVRNAADREQVKQAGRKERDRDERFLDSFRAVLATVEGRTFLWELLRRAGIYESVIHQRPEMTYYHAGKQDYGHQLLADALRADDQMYLLMEQEQRALLAQDQRSADAIQQRDTSEELQ